MKKIVKLFAKFLMSFFHTSCGQNQTNVPKDNTRLGYSESQLKEAATSKVPMGQVRNIKQDRNGNILIAAGWSGVFRYDGKSFTNLTSKLGSPRFWDVLEDRRGNLWFASTDSGVYNYNGKSLQHFTTREGLANNAVMCIYEDKAGIIWFGSGGGGVSRYDGKSFRNFTTKEGNSNNDITTIIEDKTGKLWIGTRGEAFVYDGKTFTTLIHEGKAFNNVWSLSRYDQKSLYNKKPTVTEIVSGGPAFFWGFWKLTMEVFGLELLVGCIVMMERPSRTLEEKRIRNNVYC